MRGRATQALVIALFMCPPGLGKSKPTPPICAPSLECAWQLALQAGHDNAKAVRDNVHLYVTLHRLAQQQLMAKDVRTLRTTLDEMRRVKLDRERASYSRAILGGFQAAAGMDADALKTIASGTDSMTRDMTRMGVARAWADKGRFAEAFGLTAKFENEWTRLLAQDSIINAAVKSGRADYISEVARRTDPAIEPELWVRVAIDRGELARAREATLKLPDIDTRFRYLEEIADEIEGTHDHAALAETAREFARQAGTLGARASSEQYAKAIEWLLAAEAYDEALALLPHDNPHSASRHRTVIAVHRALNGDIAGAESMLAHLEADDHPVVRGAILVRTVLAGDLALEDARSKFPEGAAGTESLERLVERLPPARDADARMVFDEWARRCATAESSGRDSAWFNLAVAQAKRGFFADALSTARAIRWSGLRQSAISIVGTAQVKAGDFAAARKTLLGPGNSPPGSDFTDELHAAFVSALADSGHVDEAFAEAVALARNPSDDTWIETSFDDLLSALVKTGQAERAFELAALLSQHDRGNSWYYLVIAGNYGPQR